MSSSEPYYNVFIRLPFPRGNFVDPPAVEWDSTKNQALLGVINESKSLTDVDWNELALRFDVSQAFLLQQTAWLYEQKLQHIKAQMRKFGASKAIGSAAPSPVPGSTYEASGGEVMGRTSSSGAGQRVSSAMSSRKDISYQRNDAVPGTPVNRAMAPPISRTSSANTTITSRNLPPISPHPAQASLPRRSLSPKPPRSRPVSMIAVPPTVRSPRPDPLSSPTSERSDSSSDSEPAAQSRLLRRPPRFASNRRQSEGGDGSDDEPAFMPIAEQAYHDPSATLRGDPRNISRRTVPTHRTSMAGAQQSQTSDSSTSSAATPARARPESISRENSRRHTMIGQLSPRRTAELAGRSPMSKGKGREGSDGTPSMGSSFSDLDDASVTQSALEEALASNMQAGGGMASRMSSISQALKNRW